MRSRVTVQGVLAGRVLLLALLPAAAGASDSIVALGAPAEFERTVSLGETVVFGDGNTITVTAYEPALEGRIEMFGQSKDRWLGAAEVEICAGSQALDRLAQGAFQIWSARKRERTGEVFYTGRNGAVGNEFLIGPREPVFSAEPVAAGSCESGWVYFDLASEREDIDAKSAVSFDNSTLVSDESLKLKVAWLLK